MVSVKETIYYVMNYLLSCRECNFIIMSPVRWVNLGKIESLWEKVVDQGTEGHAVGPCRGEILDLDTLLCKVCIFIHQDTDP